MNLRGVGGGSFPDRIGPYPISGELGRGGMGVVYLARDTKLDRRIALKVLPTEFAQDAKRLAQFKREGQLLATLNHPNIATIYSLEQDSDQHFITMELVAGETLAEWIGWKPLSIREALSICLQIASALEAAHKKGVVHRDLKPMNIKITPDCNVKVLDFGLATSVQGPDLLTSVDAIMGTPGYMSPEQLRGADFDARTDIWALGCILFECLSGKIAFEGGTASDVIVSTLDREPDWEALPGHTPRRLRDLIRRCLVKKVDKRIGMMGEVRREIEALLEEQKTGALRSTELVEKDEIPTELQEVPNNLPALINRFIGRERELEELDRQLATSRLLTITGPGGSGKTRMSLELARRVLPAHPHGVFLVELAPLHEDQQVAQSIARVLSVREEPGREMTAVLCDHLKPKSTLLVLDNCEHLVDASATVTARLLHESPQLRILATSQQRLGVPGEALWQVPSLRTPKANESSLEDLIHIEAIQLFIDRARAASPSFELTEKNASTVAQICLRLDGIPLAIELAAARVRVLSVEQILARLQDRFRLLTDGDRTSLPRQQTLRAAVDWSVDLLTEHERQLFERLSLFAGGWSLEAAEDICGAASGPNDILDLLTHLVDKSLVEVHQIANGETRYRLLETLREYGLQRFINSADERRIQEKYARYFRNLAEQAEPHLTGPEQATWLERLQLEVLNLQSAIRWFLEHGHPEEALRMSGALWRFWFVRGHPTSGRALLSRTLTQTESSESLRELRAKALHGAGVLANDQGDYDAARVHFEECLAIRRTLGDRSGVAGVLNSLGVAARDQGDYAKARTFLGEGLAIHRQLEDDPGVAMSIHALGITAHREGDCESAGRLFEEGLAIRRHLGDRRGIAALLAHLGSVAHDECRYEEAQSLLNNALGMLQELGNKRGIVFARMYLGGVARRLGEFEAARDHYRECLRISRELGDKQHLACTLEWLAALAIDEQRPEQTCFLDGAATALRQTIGSPRTPMEQKLLSRDLEDARRAVGARVAEAMRREGMSGNFEDAIQRALHPPGGSDQSGTG